MLILLGLVCLIVDLLLDQQTVLHPKAKDYAVTSPWELSRYLEGKQRQKSRQYSMLEEAL